MTIATKHGRVWTYVEEFLAIKKYDPLIMRLCKMTLLIKNTKYSFPQCLWPSNLEGC